MFAHLASLKLSKCSLIQIWRGGEELREDKAERKKRAKVASKSKFKDIPRWRKTGKKQIRPARLVRPLPARQESFQVV